MSERLRPRDLAFLAAETPTHAAPQRDGGDLRPRGLGLRLRPPGRADPRPDPVRAALPPAAPAGARAARQPGLGRRRALRPRLPRTPLRAAPPRLHRPAARAGRRGSSPGRSTGSRPLWEIYFVEGLADGQVALLYKTHQALVDGVETVDLGQVLLDKDPGRRRSWAATSGTRAGTPSSAGLLASALHDTVTEPRHGARHGRGTLGAVLRTADRRRARGSAGSSPG